MPRTCSICTHPQREAIDKDLASGQPYRGISRAFRVSEDALARHREAHLPETLAKAHDASEVARADDLLNQLQLLQKVTMLILSRAEQAGALRTMLGAVREARENLELIGRLVGDLRDGSAVNLLIVSPEWATVRAKLVRALQPFPEARQAVLAALEEPGAESVA